MIEALFDHTATIYRSTEASDQYGDVTRTFDPVATERCALVPPKTPLRDYGAGEIPAGTVEGYMRYGADVRERDVLDVVSGPEIGRRFRIVAPPNHPRGNHTELVCIPWTGALA